MGMCQVFYFKKQNQPKTNKNGWPTDNAKKKKIWN